jgi:hypothetical protein
MTGGARGTIVEVALEASERGTGRCDGLRQTLLPYIWKPSTTLVEESYHNHWDTA